MQLEITAEYLQSQGLSQTFPKRFWAKVQKTDGCWLWTGGTAFWGYGAIYRGGGKEFSYLIGAHIASWILHFGPVPEGLFVLHKCDNPPCVNPNHLRVGTQKQNMADMMSKGRRNDKCKLTQEDVDMIRASFDKRAGNGRALASAFGVCPAQIHRIFYRERWANSR